MRTTRNGAPVITLLLLVLGCGMGVPQIDAPGVGSDTSEMDWVVCPSGDCDAQLLGVQFIDSENGFAVGGTTEKGPSVILRTIDGGASWTRCPVAATGRLYSIDFPSQRRGYAVGFGVILATRDGGERWEQLAMPDDRWLASVDFVTETRGFAVGGHGSHPVFWMTTDGGESWTPIEARLPGPPVGFLRDVSFIDEQRGFVLGDGGVLAETRNGGESWVRRDAGVEAWLRSVFFVQDVGYVAASGVLLKSEDGGRGWRALASVGQRKLNDVLFLDRSTGWVTDFGGEVLETSDGGDSWRTVLRLATPTALHFQAPDRVFVVADDGKIYRHAVK